MQDAPNGTSEPNRSQWGAFETALLVGGVVVFLGLLYTMQSLLSPPLLAIAGLMLLWPLRKHQVVRAVLATGGFLLGFWMIYGLSTVLIPFVLVYLLAYFFDPIVEGLEQRVRVPRWLSSLLLTTVLVGVVALFLLLLVPNILSEVETLGTRLLDSIGDLREWLVTAPLLDRLAETGVIEKQDLINQITQTIQEQVGALTSSIPDAGQRVAESISSIFGLVTLLAITPVLLFYTMKDYPLIRNGLIELVTTLGWRREYLSKAGGIVGNYLRGQLTISAIAAFNVSVALILFDVPFALLIGLLGGLLNMIPNLGAVITNIVGLLIAMIFGDPWLVDAFIVFSVLMAQSLLEQAILTPNILSYQVGLHPVLIMLALFVFGYFLGLFGFLIAVPATALILTAYKAYREDLNLEKAPISRSTPTQFMQRFRTKRTHETESAMPEDETFLSPQKRKAAAAREDDPSVIASDP